MPGIGIGLSSAFGSKPLFYLVRDEFTDTRAEGTVDGTAATPGPGTRNAVETDGQLSIGSGVLNVPAQTTPLWGDLGLYFSPSLTRRAGLALLFLVSVAATNDEGPSLAFMNVASVDIANDADHHARFKLNGTFAIQEPPSSAVELFSYSTSTYYQVALILRTAGVFVFVKGGAFASWTLLWIDSVNNTGTLYAAISQYNNVASDDYIRVPDSLWLPVPLVSDGFADDNGTSLDAHESDGAGHAEGVAGGVGAGGSGLTWTEETGDWDIQSNRANPNGAAIATVEASDADVLIDCIVNGGTADQPAILLRWLDTSNYWYLQADRANNQLELHEYNATVDTVRASAAVAINNSTDYDLRAIAYGQTIDGYVDRNNKISYGAAVLNETKTEHGIRSENTAGQFDDFVIYVRDSYSVLSAF